MSKSYANPAPTQAPKFPTAPATTTEVEIDSSVVLKIIKAASDGFPSFVSGQLLGVDLENVLNVTHAFSYPASIKDNESAGIRSKSIVKYQNDILSHLKAVNVDVNTIGYFASTALGRYFHSTVIDNLLHLQAANPNAVFLLYDNAHPTESGISLKAYRLSEAFIQARKEGSFSTEYLQKVDLTYRNIFDELPVSIKNSHLVTLFLQTLEKKNASQTHPTSLASNFDKFDISIDFYLERNIEGIFNSIDGFHTDQGSYNWYQRQMAREKLKIKQWQHKRALENSARVASGKDPLPEDEWKTLFKLPEEPSRYDNLLISGQTDKFCSQIEDFGANVNTKLFATQKSLNI
ncbi:hypothetical protein DV454_003808 [Geotrichum candidum]|nr:hypothetical protein DV454_003808 [Geotrichum candidum]